MQETCDRRHMKVIRSDFQLPNNWELQSEDIRCFPLDRQGYEYKKVLKAFNVTMQGKYSSICQIDRIQNQRWHAGYLCHRKFFKLDTSEQWLSHGCPELATGTIIYSRFNRSFAGQHGTIATTHSSGGVRYMFYVKVLVGKSTKGTSTMKVPPSGYDSTTDNDHIFVTYHDDQAYAEYLIKYT